MTDEIKDKLKATFKKGSYSEQDIVYILVQSFKLLERLEEKPDFNLLVFYRHWVCHAKLTSASMQVFGKMRKLINKRTNYQDDVQWTDDVFEEIENCLSGYSFHRLKRELWSFSKKHLDDEGFDWLPFRKRLYEVIAHTPLIIEGNNGSEILRFEYLKLSEDDDLDGLEFSVVIDGQKFVFDMNDAALELQDFD